MSTEVNHNKIIAQAAREVLKPIGMFQKGQSRIWIDDNDWFLIVVEFQPSGWDKGSYLNVGIHYLWSNKDYISFDYGYRENEFVKFGDDANAFYQSMISLAKQAEKKVMEYRGFRDVIYAKEKIAKRNGFSSSSHEIYDKMMICGLACDNKAEVYYKKLFRVVTDSKYEYDSEYYQELTQEIEKVIHNPEQFHDYIVNRVRLQRDFWRAKSSMKKLK